MTKTRSERAFADITLVRVSRHQVLVYRQDAADRAAITVADLTKLVEQKLTELGCPKQPHVRQSAYIEKLSRVLRDEIVIQRYFVELNRTSDA